MAEQWAMPVGRTERPPGPFGLGLARETREQAVLADRLEIRRVEAPSFARPGDVVRVEVIVEGQAPIGSDAEGVVTFTRSDTGETIRRPESGVRNIAPGQIETFTYSFAMPPEAIVIDISAQERDVGGLRTTDSDTVRINASQAAAGLNVAADFGPWLVGGGAVGAGVARATDRPLAETAAIGAGVGLGSRVVLEQTRGIQLVPEFPTVPVLAVAALLGAGALLLGRIPGLDLAGQAVSRVRS